VPGPGNQVHLHYPERGERIETLRSVVPPLNPRQIIEDMDKLKMLVMVVNSGFDIEISDWRKIVHSASCPIWLDIHSLPLSRTLNSPREYLPLPEWREWAEGVNFIQANTIEMASMLGHPDKAPAMAEMVEFSKAAFELGIKAVFVTLGKDGVLALIKGESKAIATSAADEIIDTTGCGDVFCIGTVVELASGKDPLTSAAFGLRLASEAVGVKGIEETYLLANNHQEKKPGK
jgi:fructose-1-phosphate kinase PfkB-like protein